MVTATVKVMGIGRVMVTVEGAIHRILRKRAKSTFNVLGNDLSVRAQNNKCDNEQVWDGSCA